MDPGDIGPVIVMVTLIVTTGLVALLRPISKRLGSYLEVLAEQHRRELAATPSTPRVDTARITQLLENMDQRLSQIEERQEFTDRLLVERSQNTTN